MSKGKFLTEYATIMNRIGKTAFLAKYKSYALIGIGMYGSLAETEDPLKPRGTASIHIGDESAFVEATALVGRAWLVVEPEYAPKGSPIKVGRDSSNDLVVPEYSLSKNHCEFRVVGPDMFLTDLGSLNGTLVSGAKAPTREEMIVPSGSVVVFGRFQFELVNSFQFAARVGDFASLLRK
jgi:hypothetical protein